MKYKITGRCPHIDCSYYFIDNIVEEIGQHFNFHISSNIPNKIAGNVSIRLMNHRRQTCIND